jgi:GT2 family glycosyltransferase
MMPLLGRGRSIAGAIIRADRARETGDWAVAARLYRMALDRYPRNPPIWVQYGHALKESGEPAQAETAYRTALAQDPHCADTQVQLGHVLKLLGRRKEAEAAYLRAFAIDRGLADPLSELRGLGWSEADLLELRRQATAERRVERSTDPGPAESRRPLLEFLCEEFGEDAARRISGYFAIIEGLSDAANATRRRRQLDELVRQMRRLAESVETPRPIEASIVIPVYDRVEYTIAAVISLLEHQCDTRYEIVIGNDRSSDETEAVFSGLGGVVRCVTHAENHGFIGNCNLSARAASGEYLVLLNNDTIVLDNWLDELLAPFGRFRNVGLVGSKLLNSDGTLQEAGGVVWRDASGWNFGRGQDPRRPEFNYLKEVDYASGAAIAVPKAAWDDLGGFDERYAPAYFDDSDLAFALRERRLRTLYAPAAQIIHHEGISNGTDLETGIKAHQVTNRQKFIDTWHAVLAAEHGLDGHDAFLARDRSRFRKHILVIDHYIPQSDRDAGSRTIFAYVKMFVDAGLQVVFWPDNLHRDRDYAKALQDLGVEVLYDAQMTKPFGDWIAEHGRYIDYVLFSRAHISLNYIDSVIEHTRARRLYYGHDLHAARLEREYAMTGRQELLRDIEFWRDAELDIWKRADVVYYPAQEEVDAVRRQLPGKAARVLTPYIYSAREIADGRAQIEAGYDGPPSLLFVGGFRHRPNIDAAIWLVRDILPQVKAAVPELSAVIAGSSPPPAVKGLAGPGVLVTDYVSDPMLERLYCSAAVAVAPLRFGAGVKGKVVEAMRFGVPVVTTPAGAQGLAGAEHVLEIAPVAAAGFADGIVRLLRDPDLARRRALQGLDFVEREFGYAAAVRRIAIDIPELAALADSPGLLRR